MNKNGNSSNTQVRHYTGALLVVTAPSGAGKTSLVRALLQRDPAVSLSISHTTRAPRKDEQNGREYHFTDPATFHAMLERKEFVEWAEVHGNFYGSSRLWLEQAIEAGKDIILEIDWQGARQVRTIFPDTVSIFILPPSMAALEQRLHKRGTDDEATIIRRLAAAREEMHHADEFEYVILNDDFEQASADLHAILMASRLRYQQQRLKNRDFFSFIEQN